MRGEREREGGEREREGEERRRESERTAVWKLFLCLLSDFFTIPHTPLQCYVIKHFLHILHVVCLKYKVTGNV